MVSSWCELAWWDKLCPDAYLWRPKVNKGNRRAGHLASRLDDWINHSLSPRP